eukprot:scaffold105698_cov45-Phaeocystis_antarctica.AAC.1
MVSAKRLIHAVVHGNALKTVAGIQKPVVVSGRGRIQRNMAEGRKRVSCSRKKTHQVQKATGL